MSRRSALASLSVAEIEQHLERCRQEIRELLKKRAPLQQQLERIDRRLAELGEPGRAAPGRRPRNEKSLPDVITEVLSRSSKPMKVTAIAEAVEAAGYRSSSPNFRSIVNQTLIKERKRFQQAERSFYQLRK